MRQRGSSYGRARAVALLAAALWALAGCGDGGSPPEAEARSRGAGPGNGGRGGPGGPAVVEVASVETGSIARRIAVTGVVEPIRVVGVNSQLSGAILTIGAEEGDFVRAGQVMARLDDRELQAQLRSAAAAFEAAEAALDRAEQLRDREVMTEPEYEQERTRFAAARAQLDQLETRVGYATVTSPIQGVVTEKQVEAGDIVAPQTRLFTVADVSTMVVQVQVSELDVVALDVGDRVHVMLDAFPGQPVPARIRRIFPAADRATRLVPVEVALEPEGARIARPGFLARVTFELGLHDDVLLVPASALLSTDTEAVFVVENGTARRREVTTGVTSEGRIEIRSGLGAGERVVTAGANLLRDGAEVRVVNDVPIRDSGALRSTGPESTL